MRSGVRDLLTDEQAPTAALVGDLEGAGDGRRSRRAGACGLLAGDGALRPATDSASATTLVGCGRPAPGVKIEVSFFHANERHHSLAVAPRSPMPGAKKRIHHFMIEMGSMADVGRARDRCLEFGLPVVMDLGQHPNDRMVSFYGHSPSGFLFECGWGGVKVDDATWQPDAYDRVSNWGHRPYGAMPGTVPGIPAAVVEVA